VVMALKLLPTQVHEIIHAKAERVISLVVQIDFVEIVCLSMHMLDYVTPLILIATHIDLHSMHIISTILDINRILSTNATIISSPRQNSMPIIYLT
jgi:hypothetical protein